MHDRTPLERIKDRFNSWRKKRFHTDNPLAQQPPPYPHPPNFKEQDDSESPPPYTDQSPPDVAPADQPPSYEMSLSKPAKPTQIRSHVITLRNNHDDQFGIFGKPKVNEEVMADTQDNTPLHRAILTNDVIKAKELILEHPEHFNKKAYCNTPLVLAIKTGNIDVALELANQDQVDVTLKDNLGLSSIHYACMLRQDALILALLNHSTYKTPTTRLKVEYFIGNPNKLRPTPLSLYQEDLQLVTFERAALLPIVDRDKPIGFEPCYSNFLYHMPSLCTNLGFCEPEFFDSTNTIPQSAQRFQAEVKISLPSFVQGRNANRASQKIIDAINAQTLNEGLTEACSSASFR